MSRPEVRATLARAIEASATVGEEGALPAEAAGHQLIALVRRWGYRGFDFEMPEAFEAFDLLMMDLECGPPSAPVAADEIKRAATAVRLAAHQL